MSEAWLVKLSYSSFCAFLFSLWDSQRWDLVLPETEETVCEQAAPACGTCQGMFILKTSNLRALEGASSAVSESQGDRGYFDTQKDREFGLPFF